MIPIYTILVFLAKIIIAKNNQSENASINEKLLFYLSEKKLWQMEIHDNIVSEKLSNNDFVIDYDFDEINNRLFWIDRTGKIFSKHIYGESADTFLFQYYLAGSGTRIAYNPVTDKFYIIDGESQEIDLVDSSGKNQTVLFKRHPIKEEYVIREKPRKIILDHHADLMFILTDLNGVKNIYQSKTDGTAKRLLISNIGADEFCISYKEKRIFWVNTKQKVIESANYRGHNRIFVVKIKNYAALSVHHNQLFWLTSESENGCSRSTIYGCKLKDGTCDKNLNFQIELDNQCRNPKSMIIVGGPRLLTGIFRKS